ncbi:MAG: NAD(P)H-hydrate dehydratase [Candidatus Omnitrophica bacterium]|nr:NAD(P)H-hydrate dehydratase [Candidatus Omnitrophota bacterium]MDD5027212.1 NAD(P)H-hydrate dehydratase [Candidatus Omnitrophota bacterium]MDD5661724.1 NAD(P)H-hydrate dehydratase [Candidatus Omnitrophota bacterium]
MRLLTRLLPRKTNSNKNDFGHIFILAGSRPYSGAAVLCAAGAMRSGAGLVTLGIPKGLNTALIKIKPMEVMTLPLPETTSGSLSIRAYSKIKDFSRKIDILVIGPGLSRESSTQSLARKIIRKLARPMVIDADGLNALSGHLQYLKDGMVITPHPGEMARLLGTSITEVQRERKTITVNFSRRYKITLVLKGHNTLVGDKKGNLYVNPTGNPGMATAGSGDVLTGMIAAFLAQGLDSFNAAKLAVYVHGLAGDLAAREKTQISLIASDIIDKIPEAIKKCN